MLRTEEFTVNMGPQHPSTHGLLRIILTLDGERIVKAVPHTGYLHRSIEKIGENRDLIQFIPLTDRVDYCSAITANLALCLAAERLLDLNIPRRAQYLRVLASELQRLASHLIFYGAIGLELGATTPFLWAFRDREKILDLVEMLCGQRLTHNYVRPGGVSYDLPAGFAEKCREFVKYFRTMIPELEGILMENTIFLSRSKGVGVIPRDMAISYGWTGPNLRACGVDYDIRRDDPYDAYPDFKWTIPTGKNGDIWDRYWVRFQEMVQSNELVEQALEGMPEAPHRRGLHDRAFAAGTDPGGDYPGGYKHRLHDRFILPEGEVYSRVEASRGEMGVFLKGNGTSKPWRVKFRTGSFSNLSIISEAIQGMYLADAVLFFGSLDVVLPEVDR